MGRADQLVVSGVWFGRSLIGLVLRPYETYRRIIDRGSLWELGYIGVLLAVYFSVAALVRIEAFRPFLLTAQFVKLGVGVGATFLFTGTLLWLVSRRVGGKGSFRPLLLGWGYTLIPTLVWFLGTSLSFVVFPPSRTTTPQGILLSIVYLIFSAVLFFWKVTLGYLTIRFGMRLDFIKIVQVALLCAPVIGLYSVGMYALGIFRVPFL
jgi:multidrug transporter EmrE-like cation transporter